MKRGILGLALGLLFLLVPAQLLAQDGLFLGGHLNGTAYSPEDISELDEDSDTETGYGLSGIVGYGFGAIGVYAKGSGAIMTGDDEEASEDDPMFYHLDIGARLSLPIAALVPYINAAYTFQRLSQDIGDQSFTAKGSGLTGGAGIQLLFGSLALDAALNVTAGEFSEVEFNGQTQELEDATNTTVRFDVGLVFFLGGGDEN
jgi:hypothetical protein